MIKLYQIDLGVILLGIVALSCWVTYMIYNFTATISAAFKGKDWRVPAYTFCGQVIGTIIMMVCGFWIITG